MRIAVGHPTDLSDSYLKFVTQLGVDCIDFGEGAWMPGVKEQGYPDLDRVLQLRRRLRSWGLDFNRVTLPDITEDFILDRDGAERELDNTTNAMRVFAEAGVPIARQRLQGDTFNHLLRGYRSVHRGGYLGSGHTKLLGRPNPASEEELRAYRVHVWDATSTTPPGAEALEKWWDHFTRVYERLVPIADEYGIKLAMHPSDVPLPDTPFGGLGFHRIIDAFPSRNVGYLYCCGTRAEAGGLPLVLDEIHNYGRKGRIFMVHFRNVRGSMATAGAYEETALDDGDMNMFKIIQALDQVGFDGCINPDHIPIIEGDYADGMIGDQVSHQGLAYAVGYIKALLAALAVHR